MNERAKSLAVLAALLLSAAFAPSASAATFSNCVTISNDYNPTWHVWRDTSNHPAYYAAQGQTVIKQLRGCTNSNGTYEQDCAAQVWPANLQGTGEIKQIGYANVGTVTYPANCNSSAMNWFASVYVGGNDSVTGMSLAFYPSIGDDVRFSIYRYAPGGFVYWRMKVDDLSHTGWYGWRDLVQAAPSVGQVWYGIEDHSKQSQFGSDSAASPVRLRELSYRLSNGGAWNYLEGTSDTDWAWDALGIPVCWNESVTTYVGNISSIQTALKGYTGSC